MSSILLEHCACPLSRLTQFLNARKARLPFTALLAASALLSGTLSAATVYYVSSQNGNDSWSGLLPSPNSSNTDGPFQSLSRAQSAMRGSSIKTVDLRAGTYSIASTLELTSADSGETWIAYSGESPILNGGGTGGITLTNPTNVTVEGLTLQSMGGYGLYINFGSSITIRWNTLLNCGQYCISGNGANNSLIDSNVINGGGTNSGISLWYGSSNNTISHNLIENCLGNGVSLGTGTSDPPANNNIVDRNIFQNVASGSGTDMGATYIADLTHSTTGNEITNNVVDGVGGSSYRTNITKAYYLDDLVSNVLISGNVCRSCGEWAWQIHAGDHNTIVNNIFDLSTAGTLLGIYQTENSNYNRSDFGMAGNVFQRNIVYFGGAVPSNLFQVNLLSSDALPSDSKNLYYSATGASIPNGPLIVDASPVYANPEFTQPSAGNYSMPASSPAYTQIGFQALATNQGPVSGGPNSGGGSSGGGLGLTGSGNSSTTTANLTVEGPTDWVHWGTTSLTRKAGVTYQIGPWSIVGSGSAIYYTNDPRALTFTDGTGPVSATVTDGIYVNGENGFSFTAPAGTSSHTLTVYVGGYDSSGTLTAHLSDGSSPNFVDTTSLVEGQYDRNYTLTYQAASAGQTLTIQWVCNTASGNVTLNGAALQ